jgi:hypothetical protein
VLRLCLDVKGSGHYTFLDLSGPSQCESLDRDVSLAQAHRFKFFPGSFSVFRHTTRISASYLAMSDVGET